MSEPNQSIGENQSYKCWAFTSYSHQENLATRGDGGDDATTRVWQPVLAHALLFI